MSQKKLRYHTQHITPTSTRYSQFYCLFACLVVVLALWRFQGYPWYRHSLEVEASEPEPVQIFEAVNDSFVPISGESVSLTYVRPVNPVGIIILMQGCRVSRYSWFPSSKACLKCHARPVEKEITSRFFAGKFAMLSLDPAGKCWGDKDGIRLLQALSYMNVSKSMPVYGFGASNGARFLLQPNELFVGRRLRAVVVMNGALWSNPPNTFVPPPTLFIDMSRNNNLCAQNERMVKLFRSLGSNSSQLTADPRPMGPAYFNSVGQFLSLNDSHTLHTALLSEELLWPATHILITFPLHSSEKWHNVSASYQSYQSK